MFENLMGLSTGEAIAKKAMEAVAGLTTETLNGLLSEAGEKVTVIDKIKIMLEKINVSFCILIPEDNGKYKLDYCTDISALRTKIFCSMEDSRVTHCIIWLIDNRYIGNFWNSQMLSYASWRDKFMQTPYSRFLGVLNDAKRSERFGVDREAFDLLLERAEIIIKDIAVSLVKDKPLWCSADCSKWENQYIYAPICGSKIYDRCHVYPEYDKYMDIKMLHSAVGYKEE